MQARRAVRIVHWAGGRAGWDRDGRNKAERTVNGLVNEKLSARKL
jgi:hypothetical protein